MRNYQYYFQLLKKYKWIWLVLVGISVGGTYLFFSKQTRLYESRTEIYPLVMYKKTSMLSLNPCVQVKRIVQGEQFHRLLINANICPTLTAKNYEERISFYETTRHTLVIRARAENVAMADSLLWQWLYQLDYAGKQLTSMQMIFDTCSLAELIPWDYYHKQADFVDNSARCYTEVNGMFFLFDVISEPYCDKEPVYPPAMLKVLIFVFCLSACLSFVAMCLTEEIRNRLVKNKIESNETTESV